MARKPKEPQAELSAAEPMYLSASEVARYENFHLKKEVEELKAAVLQAESKYQALCKECAELKIKLTGYQLSDRRRSLDNLLSEHAKFNKEVRERLNIESEVFGYHPETGEIALSK